MPISRDAPMRRILRRHSGSRFTGYLREDALYKKGRRSRPATCCSRSIRGPTRLSSTRAARQTWVLAQAKLKLAIADNVRAKSIAKAHAQRAISLQDLDKDQAAEDRRRPPKCRQPRPASRAFASICDFTKVLSPINGRISRYYLTLGNLANQDQTLLTTVVSLDPMYAYFDVDELDDVGVGSRG